MSNKVYEEIWKSIEGFEGLYEVSNTGKVKSLKRTVKTNNGNFQSYNEKILKHTNKGYCVVVLCKDGKKYPKTIHRLVAEAFIPNTLNKPYIDHIDTNPQNNNVENLKWVTQKENCLNPTTRKNNSASKIGHKAYLTHHTEETKRIISEKHKGRKFSEEHRKHLSEAHKGIMLGKSNSLKDKHWKMEGGVRVWY